MKMSIAHALKEKNRLVKEIERLWSAVQSENSCLETHKRTTDVKKAWETIKLYGAKLVELKTKIGNAYQGEIFRKIHLLDETKNRITKLANTSGSEDPEVPYRGGEVKINRTAVFSDEMLLAMQRQLQAEANRLQDEIDEFNANTKIDFETPLK